MPESNSKLRVREVISFDKNWRFSKDDPEGAETGGFDDSDWRTLNVPHDWSIEEPFDPDMESGGTQGYLPRRAVAWYRKRFTLPSGQRAKRIAVRFDGVHNHSQVWVNGVCVGYRPYGYVSYQYDITPYLVEDGENVIAVKVDNTSPLTDRWYSGSGIYRHVWLVVTEPLHVVPWGTYVTASGISAEAATLHVQTEFVNHFDRRSECEVLTQVRDEAGHIIAEQKKPHVLEPGERGTVHQSLQLESPKLWSPDTPDLYEVYSSIIMNGEAVDDEVTAIGIREAVFDNGRGFLLNGKPLKLKGVCLHHDLGSLGAAFHERAMERRHRVLKEMGCNAIRFAHNPMAPELLDICDRMGFLVIDEAFDKWKSLSYEPIFDQWWKLDLEAMIRSDRNHACVILWSVGNEVERQGSPEMIDILARLAAYCRELDPSRPVTCAFEPHNWPRTLFHGPIEEKVKVMKTLAEHVDILALNYQEQWYEHYREAIPDKLILGAESFPYFRGNGNVLKSFVPMNPWFDVTNHDYVVGQFVWPGIDYLGETSFPYKGWNAGLIDTCGFRKPISYLHESLWSDRPMVRIAVLDDSLPVRNPARWTAHWHAPKMISGWTYPGHENQLLQLATFTNCESVELVLNGESLGVKNLEDFPNHIMTWFVPYAQGTLEAIGRTNGELCATHQLRTAGAAHRVALRPEREELTADGIDLVHVEVNIVDADGILVPNAEVKVEFELAGEGRIVGIDSGNLASDEPYQGMARTTFFGKCLVIIQSSEMPGTIELRARADGLFADTAIIATYNVH
ncbi:glycoside hydrolase family 2 TIM barrel-domain containing protein [Paenibacillus abyssi]|uniref:Beta-galactosidase n=1 Tax=Paenibacillus abyssi TaxID=1340531 RepID=A0A917G7I7_9BACL|nr:glycoside hydrolase family 2 TIM barrel-domain containing protein [Paenibacillus abyssi]GGG26956.1 beta-galactosidase [Paenibacillus abyssi]